jgi:hypothetical protein
LALELADLVTIDSDFDVSVTGFDHAEINLAIQRQADPPDPSDELPEVPLADEAITRPGTLWQLGDQRILCGDVRNRETVERLMEGDKARLVFTDPPYNVPISGHVSGLGRRRHRGFAVASGEMTSREFTDFLEIALANLASASMDGSLHYVCMDWRHLDELMTAGKRVYTELKNPMHLEQDQWGDGLFLSIEARARL